MILLTLYPLVIWALAFWLRRTWRGFVVVVAGSMPLLALGVYVAPGYRLLPLSLAAVLLAVGLFIAAQPKRAPGERCLKCDYLLEGNVSGLCPECGTSVAKPRNRARRLPATMDSPLRTRTSAAGAGREGGENRRGGESSGSPGAAA